MIEEDNSDDNKMITINIAMSLANISHSFLNITEKLKIERSQCHGLALSTMALS
jgi:hypothetical protein